MLASWSWIERGRRLAGMSRQELAVRTCQAVAKRWDLMTGRCLPSPTGGNQSWLQASGRFFFSGEEIPEILGCLRDRFPKVVDEIVERADQICQHRFDLLGYEGVDYGQQIDWHLDAVHGKRAPRRPWFKIRYLDFDQVGDHKVTWELNRHQQLVTLAKAYRLTGEEQYARELFAQWYHWHRNNPYGIGINWASSLEVAFRSLSWLWVRSLLEGCSIVPDGFPADLVRALTVNARHIERFLSTYFSPNTHLLGEGVALFFIGALCPALPAAQRWETRGWQIVLNQAQRQVLPDGMHFEQSIYYHVYATDFFLHSRILAALNGIPIPPALDQTIQRMLDVLYALNGAGPLPHLGDDDGGRLFDPRRNRIVHMADPLATGAVLFDRGDLKAGTRDICEETLWLLGTETVRRFDELTPQERKSDSFALEASGMYVMSTPLPACQRLIIDAGPHGAGRAGHGHSDALSVQVAVRGEELLIDPGTCVYVDSDDERNRFRGTAAHNTIQVDCSGQMESAGPFAWRQLPNTSVHHWQTGSHFDFFQGAHDGYRRLPYGVQHRRYVVYSKPYFWFVRDVLEGGGIHQIEAFWHFAPGALSRIQGGFAFSRNQQTDLALLFASIHDCTQEIQEGWCSPVYGRKEPSPVLRLGVDAPLPVEFAAILVPVSRGHTSLGCLWSLDAQDPSVRAYRYSSGQVTGHLFFASQSMSWHVDEWASDAQFLFCSTAVGDKYSRLVVSDGSYVHFRGHRLLASPMRQRWMEWRSDRVSNPSGDNASDG
jgi:hypothetical protein